MNIVEAKYSPDLFLPAYDDVNTWAAWNPFLKAIYGIPMDDWELAVFQKHTGLKTPPKKGIREAYAICGRRSGKSRTLAELVVYEALVNAKIHKKKLAAGELGIIAIISVDRAQSQTMMRYIRGILMSNPILEQYIVEDLKESIEVSTGIKIEVFTPSFRSIRGRTIVVCVMDEPAFYFTDGQRSDKELKTAIVPAMLTVPSAKLICISSPYGRQGILYEAYRDHYGKEDDNILVWQAATTSMNPLVSQEFIDKELEKDPAGASAEYLAIFREDIEQFLSLDAINACVIPHRTSLPAYENVLYQAFCDPSGGRQDSFTLGISHIAKGKLIIDQLRAWKPPLNPDVVTKEISDIIKQYRLSSIVSDRYAGEWVSSSFRKHGITHHACELTKSELYLSLEARVNTLKIEFPDNQQLINELSSLERRRGRSGKDSVDHPPGRNCHDDLANAAAGAAYEGFKDADLLFPALVQRIMRRELAEGGGTEH